MSTATDAFIQENQSRFLAELKELLRIPSISTLPENRPDIDRAAIVADSLRRAGIEHVETVPTAGHPLLYGDWMHAARRHPQNKRDVAWGTLSRHFTARGLRIGCYNGRQVCARVP
jgi:acetylornithine deacetylase/succinyl-diaminopimelate desuccinylase-like protein